MKHHLYGRPRLQSFSGVSRFQQMRDVISLKWASGKQPKPIQKFSGVTAKVRLGWALALVTLRKQG